MCRHLFICANAGTIPTLANGMPAFFAEAPDTEAAYKMLAVSQPVPAPETIAKLYRSTNIMEKAQINSRQASLFSFLVGAS